MVKGRLLLVIVSLLCVLVLCEGQNDLRRLDYVEWPTLWRVVVRNRSFGQLTRHPPCLLLLAPVGIWSVFALGLQVHRALLRRYLDFFEFNLVLDGRVDQSVGRCDLVDHASLRLCELRVVTRSASRTWKATSDIIILESADVVISLIHVTARCVFAQLQRAYSVPSLEAGAEIPKG